MHDTSHTLRARRTALSFWRSSLGDDPGFGEPGFDDRNWITVSTPHNWEDYHGYHAVSHGNLHGTAWYRSAFEWAQSGDDRLYAFFEGVGSYASVYCNGLLAGKHAGGRTTFTVDLTPHLKRGTNLLAIRAHHPEKIDDLPFICGGCWGAPNTEGSQPFGIFRPAWLERTGPVRVEPWGVLALTPELSAERAVVEAAIELHNASHAPQEITLRTELHDPDSLRVDLCEQKLTLRAGEKRKVTARFKPIAHPRLWSPKTPQLHRLVTVIECGGRISHMTETPFGLRWFTWPEIVEPDRERNVVSPDRRGVLISTGEETPTPENNGLTRILRRHETTPVTTSKMGVIVRHDPKALPAEAHLSLQLSLQARASTEISLLCEIQNGGGTIFFHQHRATLSVPSGTSTHHWAVPPIHIPHCWAPIDPYLYKIVVELRSPDGTIWERTETFFGIRAIDKPLNLNQPVYELRDANRSIDSVPLEKRVLRLNGEPLFLNGTCEYEHLLGNDHAFTDEQVSAEVAMMRSAGFNAFRDAHHPHNLRYYSHWDRLGMVCWTQMASHVWFDTPEFRENYKRSVMEWVRERRNHPCILIWGLQNESSLPQDFALELRELIRELDPTSPSNRITATCNGGKGSDWNIPQEWSGTYGGNCHDYDLERLQLVGEYGAWRRFGVHTEHDYSGDENDRSETWACYAMETKIRKGHAVRDRAVGHFHWIFNTFQNPGRSPDNYEGPDNAEIGSVNNKGLVTAWHQPSDLYYLFRSNFADPATDPMVYIVSHTWPDRWKNFLPRRVHLYSNCEEVELFNGISGRSFGAQHNPGIGHHFIWDDILPTTNLLYAVARQNGKEVARDVIALDHLAPDPSVRRWTGNVPPPAADPGPVLFRISCGDFEDRTDSLGRHWLGDQSWTGGDWGCTSWGSRFDNIPDDLASRGYTMTPVRGTPIPEIYRNYRYGRHELKYHFRVNPGTYRLRLHLTEPWFGVGSRLDCTGWRLFDVAVNGRIVDRDLDIWSHTNGDHCALVREYVVTLREEVLTLHFPFVRVNQAVLCGIELFSEK